MLVSTFFGWHEFLFYLSALLLIFASQDIINLVMADVEFEEQQDVFYSPVAKKVRQTKLISLAIKLGLAKDERSANFLFAIIAVVSIVATVFVCFYFILGYNPFAGNVVNKNSSQSQGVISRPGIPRPTKGQNQVILK